MTVTPAAFVLTDRRTIVTGAAAGIGRAIALAFAAMGADVALCDRDAAGLQATADDVAHLGRAALARVLDVRDADAVAAFLADVGETFGGVDVLVNNAGGGFESAFIDVSAKGEDALIRENFTSVTAFVRGAIALMPAASSPPTDAWSGGVPRGGGSIISITSIEAHRAGPGYAVYAAMKAAVANLTASLALELGARHIRVNAIAPDVIPTPGIGGEIAVTTPLPYAGHVDDIAAAAVFLASNASAFITGTTLHVDGGNLAAGGWYRTSDGSFRPR